MIVIFVLIGLSLIAAIIFLALFIWNVKTGQLSPIVAAILMPLSSVTAVAFVTIGISLIQRKV